MNLILILLLQILIGDYIKTNGTNTGLNLYYSFGNMMFFDYQNFNFKFTFYNSFPVYLKIAGYENNKACKIHFKIDDNPFVINEYTDTNTTSSNFDFNSFYNYPNIITPGIHTITIENIENLSAVITSAYLQGFIFTKANNINMPKYINNRIWNGNLTTASAEILNKNNITFKNVERLILQFKNENEDFQTIYIPIIKGKQYYKQIFPLFNTNKELKYASFEVNTQSNTFNLENESDYTLVNIFIDSGNFESPYNY